MKVINCQALVWAGLLLYAFSALADEQSQDFEAQSIEDTLLFDDIPSVFGASKYEQKVTDAPSRVSIVTAKEIQQFGYRSLDELLRSLPGFSINSDRNYSYVGVRGFGTPGDYDTRVLQLVDGHRINDNIYGSLFSDNSFPVDLHLIDRVEVIRGPSSSLYGSSAFFAVVNVITKRGRDLDGWEASGSLGSLDSKQAQLSYGRRLSSGFEFIVSATVADSDGNDRLYYPEFDDPATNNGRADDVDDEQFERLFTRVAYGDFEVEGVYGKREKSVPTASYGTVFNSPETRTWDERSYLNIKYQTLTTQGAEVLARIYYDSYAYEGEYLYDYGDAIDPYLSVNYDSATGRWWGSELQWNQQVGRHRLIAGVDYRDSFKEEQKNFDQDGVYLDSSTDSSVWALFVQDEVQLVDNLVLNLGLRYDDYSNFGSTTNPRAALIWSPGQSSTLKALYGEAFRAPNAYENFYNDSGLSQKPSLNLEPETIKTLELVWEQQFKDGVRTVASIYKNKITDLIAITTDPADDLLIYLNQGDAEAEGFEFEVEKQWDNGAQSSLSYSYQRAEDSETGQRLVNYATDMVKLNLTAPLRGERLGIALQAQYESGRLTIAEKSTDGRVLVNLGLVGSQWFDGFSASATIYNLFDEEYAYPGSEEHLQDVIRQDGRTFRLQLTYAF